MAQHQQRIKHMAQRRASGLKHKEIAEEFGMSRQNVGRILQKNSEKDENDGEC